MDLHHRFPRYRVYLLRCWQEPDAPPAHPHAWRFSLEDPSSGARLGFATWAVLVAFLQAELAGAPHHADGATADGYAER